MNELVAQIANGLAIGGVYSLVALGFVLIFGVAKIVNFAQGSQVVAAAYLAWAAATQWGLPLPVAFLVAAVGSIGIALLVDLIAVEWLGNSAEIAPLLSTLALSFILDQAVLLIWSPDPVKFPNPFSQMNVKIGPISTSATDIVVLGVSIFCMAALAILVKFTWFGRAIRASAQDPIAAAQFGVRVHRQKLGVFALSGVLGAVAGVLVGMYFEQIDPTMGLPFGLKGFAAAMIGGVVSLPGGVLGGLVIGVSESLTAGYIGSEYQDVFAFVILLVILLFRPQGILGSKALSALGGSRGAGAIPTTSPLADSSGFPVSVMRGRDIGMRWTILVTVAIGVVATVLVNTYWSGVLAQGAIFATAALGLTVLTGMTGYVSVGHSALVGVGAYVCARVTTAFDWPFEAVLAAVVCAGIVAGLIFAIPLLGLSGHTIALATLALGEIGYLLMLTLMSLTRGPLGIGNIPGPKFAILGGRTLDSTAQITGIAFGVLVISLLVVYLLRRGQIELRLRSIREDRVAAEASGVSATPYVVMAIVVSSVMAGLSGMMFAYQQSYVSPDSFDILLSFLLLTIILTGGIVSPLGAVIGGIVVIALPEVLRNYPDYRQVLYGVLLILVIRFLPSGLTSITGYLRLPGRGRRDLATTAGQSDGDRR